MGRCRVPAGFPEVGGEMGGWFSVGRKGEVAGGSGEIGESIRRGFGSVWCSGLLCVEEAEFGCSGRISGEERVTLSLGIPLEKPRLSSGMFLPFSPLYSLLKSALNSPPFCH